MGVIFVRTDDRFIHGQVTTGWVRKVGAKKIILVNDNIAKDDLIQKLQRLSAGSGVNVIFLSQEQAIDQIRKGGMGDEPAFLLVENPVDLLKLVEAGLEIKEANLGNLRYEPGRTKIVDWHYVDERQLQALNDLARRGIRLSAQWAVAQKSVNVNDLLAKRGGAPTR